MNIKDITFSPKKDLVGLNIGSSSVKLLELENHNENEYRLKSAGVGYLPPGSIVDGALKAPLAVSDCIRNLISNLKVKNKNVATSVSGHSVIIKNISLPIMNEAELEESIKWEAEQYIPFDIDEVNIDFQILGDSKKDKNLMNVLLVAAKQDMINEYVEVIKDAGLNPTVMDVDSFALENMFETNYPEEGETIALIDIGSSIANLNVLKNGTTVFTRDVSIGGNRITAEIQDKKKISFEEADVLKMGKKLEGIDSREIDEIIEGAALSLAVEIQRSLDFFWVTFSNEQITKIYLSGGCSKSAGFKKILQRRIADIPIEEVNPFSKIHCSRELFDSDYLEYIAPFMAVSVGLALRQVGDKYK